MAPYFNSATFEFLDELARHNDREWFHAHRDRFLAAVQEPALRFITDFAPRLATISPHLVADPRPQGGSLFRIHRDTRFSKDKTPYKTHLGMRFGHEGGLGVHAPGLYLHIEPGASYAGVGLWRPDTGVARAVRDAIAADPEAWRRAAYAKPFLARFVPAGDSLTRPPAGFPPDHPLISDLKRKEFVAGTRLDDDLVTSSRLMPEYTAMNRAAAPFLAFLTRAVGLPF